MILASAPAGHGRAVAAAGEELGGGVEGVGVGGFAAAVAAGVAEDAVAAVAHGVVEPGDDVAGAGEVEVAGAVGVGPGAVGPLGVDPGPGGLGIGVGVGAGGAALVLQLPQALALGALEEPTRGGWGRRRPPRRSPRSASPRAHRRWPPWRPPGRAAGRARTAAPWPPRPGWCRWCGPASPPALRSPSPRHTADSATLAAAIDFTVRPVRSIRSPSATSSRCAAGSIDPRSMLGHRRGEDLGGLPNPASVLHLHAPNPTKGV